MFIANIGFLVYLYISNNETRIIPYEIIFLIFYYYRFILPICIIILLFYNLYERKLYKQINSKAQNIVTKISYTVVVFIVLEFVLFIFTVAYIAHGLDM